MSHRTRARSIALQVLFEEDQSKEQNPATADQWVRRRLRSDDQREFARSLIAGVRRNRARIDAVLTDAAENWSIVRMAATDRNILRLGAFELLYTDTPPRVVIDQAVELAKRFGTANSGGFVNGILDRLFHASEAEKQS
jgi:transcription antitermination protein NusB